MITGTRIICLHRERRNIDPHRILYSSLIRSLIQIQLLTALFGVWLLSSEGCGVVDVALLSVSSPEGMIVVAAEVLDEINEEDTKNICGRCLSRNASRMRRSSSESDSSGKQTQDLNFASRRDERLVRISRSSVGTFCPLTGLVVVDPPEEVRVIKRLTKIVIRDSGLASDAMIVLTSASIACCCRRRQVVDIFLTTVSVDWTSCCQPRGMRGCGNDGVVERFVQVTWQGDTDKRRQRVRENNRQMWV